jgi:hypothetical protein
MRPNGICAVAAGAIFIGVQINHPPADVAHLLTTEMTLRETAKVLMAILALAGFTGMFARHRGQLGRLGRAGYSLLTAGYLAVPTSLGWEAISHLELVALHRCYPRSVQAVHDARPHTSSGSSRRSRGRQLRLGPGRLCVLRQTGRWLGFSDRVGWDQVCGLHAGARGAELP